MGSLKKTHLYVLQHQSPKIMKKIEEYVSFCDLEPDTLTDTDLTLSAFKVN